MPAVLGKTHQRYDTLEAAILGTEAPGFITAQLTLVDIDFFSFNGTQETGQLVVAKTYVDEVQKIFGRMLDAKFPIHSIIPIVFFDWDDHASISANNTSGFNYRLVAGTDGMSKHALGNAIDINPNLNPYIYPKHEIPAIQYPYAPHDPEVPGTIVEDNIAVQAFDAHGWEWGGRWADGPDHQHFEK
jgi:hypothetical protein